jgi:hypothetical protein
VEGNAFSKLANGDSNKRLLKNLKEQFGIELPPFNEGGRFVASNKKGDALVGGVLFFTIIDYCGDCVFKFSEAGSSIKVKVKNDKTGKFEFIPILEEKNNRLKESTDETLAPVTTKAKRKNPPNCCDMRFIYMDAPQNATDKGKAWKAHVTQTWRVFDAASGNAVFDADNTFDFEMNEKGELNS